MTGDEDRHEGKRDQYHGLVADNQHLFRKVFEEQNGRRQY
jgi:hypothetical protein